VRVCVLVCCTTQAHLLLRAWLCAGMFIGMFRALQVATPAVHLMPNRLVSGLAAFIMAFEHQPTQQVISQVSQTPFAFI